MVIIVSCSTCLLQVDVKSKIKKLSALSKLLREIHAWNTYNTLFSPGLESLRWFETKITAVIGTNIILRATKLEMYFPERS